MPIYIPSTLFYKEISVTGGIDKQGHRTYQRKFFVRVWNWQADSPPLTWGDIPIVRYDPYITPWGGIDPGARALELKATPTEQYPGDYIVTVDYGSQELKWDRGNSTGDPKQNDKSVDPLNRPLILDFDVVHGTKVMSIDLLGNPVVNSAGQPYNPPIEKETTNLVINFSKYMPFGDPDTFDPVAKIKTFVDSVNSIALNIPQVSNEVFPPLSLRCTKYKPTIVNEGGANTDVAQAYYKCDVTVESAETRPGYWNGLYLDAGTQQLGTSMTDPPIQIIDQFGQPVTANVPLNGSGKALAAGMDPYYLISGGPNTQTPSDGQYSFEFYQTADFTQFFA